MRNAGIEKFLTRIGNDSADGAESSRKNGLETEERMKPPKRPRSLTAALIRREEVWGEPVESARILKDIWAHLGGYGGSSFVHQPVPSEFRLGVRRSRQFFASIDHVAFEKDGSLVGIASSDGRIEVHEFDAIEMGCESKRLSLDTGLRARISGFTFNPCNPNEVVVSFPKRNCLWQFDLERCNSRSPTYQIPTSSGTESITKLQTGELLRCSTDGKIELYDLRVASTKGAQTLWTADNAISRGEPATSATSADCFASAIVCSFSRPQRSSQQSLLVCFDMRTASSAEGGKAKTLNSTSFDSRIEDICLIDENVTEAAILFSSGRNAIFDTRSFEMYELYQEAQSRSRTKQNMMVQRSYEISASNPVTQTAMNHRVCYRRRCCLRNGGGRTTILVPNKHTPGEIEVFSVKDRAFLSTISLASPKEVCSLSSHPRKPFTIAGLSDNIVEVIGHNSI